MLRLLVWVNSHIVDISRQATMAHRFGCICTAMIRFDLMTAKRYGVSPVGLSTLRPILVRSIVALALLAATLLGVYRGDVRSAAAQSASDPLVLAFYYTWFDDATWTYEKLSDLPAQGYVSSDRSAMGRHIDQAKSAGIDAFLVAWYGPNGNQTEPNLAALLEEAAARNFKIGILFETNSPFLGGTEQVTSALRHALNVHAYHPAFLRADGRPVIFFWRTQMFGVGAWQQMRSQVDPGYHSLWIADGVDTSYLSVFDGHHLYSNTWNPPANLEAVNQKFAGQVSRARESSGVYKLWVATVMPGYDDVRIRGGAGFAQDREGGDYYARSWQAAISSQPNWVVITSFNEWPEGSYIEPSAAYGDAYLSLTTQWSQQFKSGGGVATAAIVQPKEIAPAPDADLIASSPPDPTSTPLPEPTTPTLYVETDLLNVRSGPDVTHEIIGTANRGRSLPVIGRLGDPPEWWQIDFEGQVAWVNATFVRAAGPLEQTPVIPAPPLEDIQLITGTTPLAATVEPSIQTMRASAHRSTAPGWGPVLSPRP
jgi:hypothetical protein